MSETATLTRVPGASATAAMALATDMGVGIVVLLECWSCGEALRQAAILAQRRGARSSCYDDVPFRALRLGPPLTPTPSDEPQWRRSCGLHGAVLLFGFAGLFGKWLDLPPVCDRAGPHDRRCGGARGPARHRRAVRRPFDVRLVANGAVLALHWVAFFAAIQIASVAIGLLGFASFPLFVLVLERVMLGQRWGRREVVTAVLVLTGLLLVVPDFSGLTGPCKVSPGGCCPA